MQAGVVHQLQFGYLSAGIRPAAAADPASDLLDLATKDMVMPSSLLTPQQPLDAGKSWPGLKTEGRRKSHQPHSPTGTAAW